MTPPKFAIVCAAAALSACTSINVKPVSQQESAAIDHICIRNNPRVQVEDFTQVLEQIFSKHGITSEVIGRDKPAHCAYTLSYSALRSWDVTPYLSQAKLSLKHNNRSIAKASYHLRGGGGLSLTKWASTETKMTPVIEQLLGKQPTQP